ncbi:hypothetical protein OESDEN_05171 [Oesophagostomum dentatum]|uniref:Uncharacterized protein n=1 Tax=Oesophagostomum dentatum TaxID=61180 RepID=A0A0B1TBE0_OESDE|nr:hypothetical protein OESDEN_05171 [Oesophagostomum dentatum]
MIEVSDNPALISNINRKEEPIRILFDAPIFVQVANTRGDGDTLALGLFFRYPGRNEQREAANYSFSFTVHEKRLRDVAPDASEIIGNIQFHSIYGLARLISIYEREKADEHRRFLMLDPAYEFLTVTGVRKAFTFFKNCCDHASARRGTHFPVEQLNQVNDESVKFAKVNSWDSIAAASIPNEVLLLAPDGIRTIQTALKLTMSKDLKGATYTKLKEAAVHLQSMETKTCVLTGPTADA